MDQDDRLLKKLILLAGGALKAEDTLLRSFAKTRDSSGGILRAVNEHYYQFIFWRAASHLWDAKVEYHNRCDVVLLGTKQNRVAAIEMKLWMSTRGERELPGINFDIEKLREIDAENKFIVIFAANPSELTDENLLWLERKCELRSEGREIYRFETEWPDSSPTEFWVAGWPVG